MRFFTKEWNRRMQDAHLLTIPESDEEWEDFIRGFEEEGENVYDYLNDELESVKDELLLILPDEFHPYVLNGTINKPELEKSVRERLVNWQREETEKYERVMEEASQYMETIRGRLPRRLVEIVEDGLHDAQVQYVHRMNDSLRITLNGSGSFSKGQGIVIEIEGKIEEKSEETLHPGMYWLYEEADVDDEGFRLGVLFDGGEWEVVAKDFAITHYYRYEDEFGLIEEDKKPVSEKKLKETEKNLGIHFPSAYKKLIKSQNGGKLNHSVYLLPEQAIFIERLLPVEELQENDGFLPFAECNNGRFAFKLKNNHIVYISNSGIEKNVADDFDQFLEGLYTEEYREYTDEFEPLPPEELEEALFSDELEKNVQAWNTLYINPEPFVNLIEKGILHYLMSNDEERKQVGEFFAEHFLSINLFSEEVAKKIHKLLEDV